MFAFPISPCDELQGQPADEGTISAIRTLINSPNPQPHWASECSKSNSRSRLADGRDRCDAQRFL